jgi:hypothetical protein
MFRTLTIGFLSFIVLFGAVLGAELVVKPLYSDKRFPPTDKLHA